MKAVNAADALIKQVSVRPVGVIKVEWRGGDLAAATGLFLQVHNSAVTPSVGAVPLGGASWPLSTSAEGYKDFKNGELRCTEGCFVGVSSTEATWTAATLNDKFANLRVELCSQERPTTMSTAGDLTSAVTGLDVWSEATGAATPKKLITLEVDGTNLGEAGFIMIFGKDTVGDGDRPVAQWPIAAGAALTKAAGQALQFGEQGRSVESIDTALRRGLRVKISTTTGTLTIITGGNTCRIKAWYK